MEQTKIKLKTTILQAMVEAALSGHDIGEWRALDAKERYFQAVCRQCHQPTLVSAFVLYAIPGTCPG